MALRFSVDHREGRDWIEDVEVTNVYGVTLYDYRVAEGKRGWPLDLLANGIDKVSEWVTFWNGVLADDVNEMEKARQKCEETHHNAG